jgi:hypothetical protein
MNRCNHAVREMLRLRNFVKQVRRSNNWQSISRFQLETAPEL